MDYIDIEREKVFRDRTDIDEFDVNNPDSLDAIMLKRINDSRIIYFKDAGRLILKCFNNAYYITILILNSKHPVHYFNRYIEIAESAAPHVDANRYVLYEYRYLECMTMAMVVNYLRACSPDYFCEKRDNRLLSAINDYHHNSYNFGSVEYDAPVLYFDNVLSYRAVNEKMVNKELFYPKLPLLETPAEKQIEELKAKIKELEKEIEVFRKDIPDVDVDKCSQRAYIARLLIESLTKMKYGDRTKWAVIMSAISNASSKTCLNVFSEPPSMGGIKQLEDIRNAFQELDLDVAI